MLDIFKKNENFLSKDKRKDFYFVLKTNQNGGYIEIIDKNKKPLEIDYKGYSGVKREILQIIKEYKKENFFNINWEGDEDKLYLDKYPRIIELLKSVDNLVDENFEKIEFEKEIKRVVLSVQEDKNIKLSLNYDMLITREYAYKDKKIIPVFNIGDNFSKISYFNTETKKENLEEILSIFVSNFENVKIEYEDYKEEKGTALLKPALVFEKVTDNKRLVLKILAEYAKLTPAFFEEYNVSKIVQINEMEKKLNILECDYEEVIEFYQDVLKTLNGIKRKIKSEFFEEDGMFVLDKETAEEFLSRKIVDIVKKCEIYGKEKLKEYKYTPINPKVNLKVDFKNKVDLLGEVKVEFEGEEFDVFEFINLYKKNSYIPLKDGNKGIIDKSYIQKLQRIFKKEDGKAKISFFDLPEIEKMIEKKSNKIFKTSSEFYNGFNKLKSSKFNFPKLNAKLRNYQKFGIKWLKYLYDNEFGGCLADDMGLGKTLQTIALITMIYNNINKPVLVVMPKTLLSNWQNEIKKFSNLDFYVYYGNDRDIDKLKNSKLVLTTYGTLRNDIEKFKNLEFDTVILDESQNIKNIESKISKAVMLLNAKHKFALSGTPIENSLFELYSLFRFLNPGMFGSASEFKRNYALPIQSEANEDVTRELKAKISPFILRRLKKDVLKELPQKQENIVLVEMNEAQKEFYESRRKYYKGLIEKQIQTQGFEKSKFFVFQILNELRIIATAPELKAENISSSKIKMLFEMLEEIVLNNHKVLIFSNFLGVLDLISSKAEEIGYNHLIMTGATRNREELVKKFQEDKNISLFLMTLKVGGVGLNLTSADYVFIVDPWWNVAAENQAIDRVYRIGQKNKVFSYKLITKGSIEEKIIKLQEQKKELSDMIVKADEIIKTLSKEEIDYILGE
jgi:SNF2 family DNA or RNA helicase